MAEYKLKAGQERFQVVDGPFKNRQYEPGKIYPEVPPNEADRFDEVFPPVAAKKASKQVEKNEEGDQP